MRKKLIANPTNQTASSTTASGVAPKIKIKRKTKNEKSKISRVKLNFLTNTQKKDKQKIFRNNLRKKNQKAWGWIDFFLLKKTGASKFFTSQWSSVRETV
jgi:hypothetical protein